MKTSSIVMLINIGLELIVDFSFFKCKILITLTEFKKKLSRTCVVD